MHFAAACLWQFFSQVNSLATDAAAAKKDKVLKPFTEKGSLKAYAPFWSMRKEPEGSSVWDGIRLACYLLFSCLHR